MWHTRVVKFDDRMKHFVPRFIALIFGLFLYALGIVLTINANIGYAPWEVFHVGLSFKAGFSIGVASIFVGLAIVAIVVVCREKIGLGTVLNMILIGVFLDLIFFLNIIPRTNNLVIGIAMLVAGLFVISLGSFFYIKAGFGAGPRDSLMVLLNRKTKIPVGICRSALELAVTAAGWFLGGMVGIGTVISVVAIGFCIQITFAILKFIPAEVKHETIAETYKKIKKK